MKKYLISALFLISTLSLASCGGGSGNSCDSTDDCKDGDFCSATGECIEDGSCNVHNDCDPVSSGEICNATHDCIVAVECGEGCAEGGVCSEALDVDVCIPEGTCLDSDDCASGELCNGENICTTQTSCESNDECGLGTFCASSGMCLPDGECANTIDCSSAQLCDSEDCVDREDCSSNATVCDNNVGDEGTLCSDAGYCIPDDECRNAEDCAVPDCGTEGEPPCEVCTNDTCTDDASCVFDSDCDEVGIGFFCDNGTCVFDDRCGNSGQPPLSAEVNLMIVLDRSGSMTGLVGEQGENAAICGNRRKWHWAIEALVPFLGNLGEQSKIGFIPFPDPKHMKTSPNCPMENPYTLDGITLPRFLSEGNVGVIQDVLENSCEDNDPAKDHYYNFDDGDGDNLYPDGPLVTPLYQAFEQAAMDPAFQGDDEGNILYIGDGAITGGCDHTLCELINNAAHTLGNCNDTGLLYSLFHDHNVKTFVVGYGDRQRIKETNLNELAVAGGTALPGTTKYYLAEDGVELIQQLIEIGNQIKSCTYTFPADDEPQTVGDPEDIMHVFIGTQEIDLDADDGFTFTWTPDGGGPDGTGKVVFHGDACDLLSETTDEVAVFLGCQGPG